MCDISNPTGHWRSVCMLGQDDPMRTISFPQTELRASNVVLGLMRIAELADDDIRTLYDSARDAGINVFDHADIYGPSRHACEERFGQAIKISPAERESI